LDIKPDNSSKVNCGLDQCDVAYGDYLAGDRTCASGDSCLQDQDALLKRSINEGKHDHKNKVAKQSEPFDSWDQPSDGTMETKDPPSTCVPKKNIKRRDRRHYESIQNLYSSNDPWKQKIKFKCRCCMGLHRMNNEGCHNSYYSKHNDSFMATFKICRAPTNTSQGELLHAYGGDAAATETVFLKKSQRNKCNNHTLFPNFCMSRLMAGALTSAHPMCMQSQRDWDMV